MSAGNDWYNLNAQRAYPLTDGATATDDAGALLPADALVDCNLAFPNSFGDYAFIGSLTVTDRLVSLTIMGSQQADTADTVTPLAALTILKPVRPHQAYALNPLQAGVGGFVVFESTTTPYIGRFSQPQQSLLLPRCAHAYTPLPVKSLRKQGLATGLTGLVKLSAGADITITKEALEIEGTLRDAFVVALSSAVVGRNVLQDYIGPCNVRPESKNCLSPGVEAIGPAVPDCHGNIDIVFVNLSQRPFEDCGPGIVVDTDLGLAGVCAARTPGRFAGQNLCLPGTSSAQPPQPSDSSVAHSDGSSNAQPCAELPYCETFDFADTGYFRVTTGTFNLLSQDSPQELCPLLLSSQSSVAVPSVSYGSFDSLDCRNMSSSVGTQDEVITETTESLSCGSGDITDLHTRAAYGRNAWPGAVNIANMVFATGAPNGQYATALLPSNVAWQNIYGGVHGFDLAAAGVPAHADISEARLKFRMKASTAFALKISALYATDMTAGTFYPLPDELTIISTADQTYVTADLIPSLPSWPAATRLDFLQRMGALFSVVRTGGTPPYPTVSFSLDSVELEVVYTADPCVTVTTTTTTVIRIPVYETYQDCQTVQYVGYRTDVHHRITKYTRSSDWSYTASGTGGRNIALWDACALSDSRSKQLTTDVMLWSSTQQQNGGLLLNYHQVDLTTNPHYEYYAVLLDKRVGKVRVVRFTGAVLSTVHEVTPTRGFVFGHWYRIVARIVPVTGVQTAIAVVVTGITDPSWPAVSFSLAVNDYMPADGVHGVISDRAKASFAFFRVEDYA